MRFSERYGYNPRNVLQLEVMDKVLRMKLWNAWVRYCSWDVYPLNWRELAARYWDVFFAYPLDHFRGLRHEVASEHIKKGFFGLEWWGVYDFLEFTAEHVHKEWSQKFRNICNEVLECENSAYRFVGTQIAPITSETEIRAVEEALEKASPLTGVHTHLERALEHLSDRENPDYRNSIKESISAVESLARIITGSDKATLGGALKEMDKHVSMHGALKQAFSKLYGWTSDEDGIRHALMDKGDMSFSDAKFMLVACSAFVNYLVGKAAEGGITLCQP